MPKRRYEPAARLLDDRPLIEQLFLKERAMSAVAEGITISDNRLPDNPIIFANRGFERLTGYPIEDVLGRNCRFLQGPDTDPGTVKEIREAVRAERACTVEILNYREDGTPFWNQLSITPVRDGDDGVTNYIGIQSDVTARKNAEEALRETATELERANRRMKSDLEEARQLQLAMLPKTIPQLPHLEIDVCMDTAEEVGGDYYDFVVDENGELTAAIGDATGHGLKAGTIVTATKLLFVSLAHQPSPVEILREMSRSLKRMQFRQMYMAMIVLKATHERLTMSSAGMPYTCHYIRADDAVEEITLKGMPLGGFPDFPYQSREMELKSGDAFLLMSDGLMELRNGRGEFFGSDRIRSLFRDVAREPARAIIRHLARAAEEWAGTHTVQDDMTLMVMKVK